MEFKHDKSHPIVIGTSGEEIGHGPFRADNIAKNGLFSVHPFTLYAPISSRTHCSPRVAPMVLRLRSPYLKAPAMRS
jgi:hypothetical protein